MKNNSISMSGSSFNGNIVQGDVHGNVEANMKTQSENQKTLVDSVKEIQRLLKQLESTNPTATEVEKVIYVNDETSPGFKRRAVAALKAGGGTALEEVFDSSYFNVGKAIWEAWMQPE